MINRVSAVGRLFLRPASLAYLYMLGLAVGAPLFFSSDKPDPSINALTTVLFGWSFSVIGSVGVLLTGATQEAHSQLFAFPVPNFRSKLVSGKNIIGLSLIILLALATSSVSGTRSALIVLCCAVFSFSLATLLTDGLVSRAAATIVPVAAYVLFFYLDRARQLLESMPPVVVLVASATLLYSLQRERSNDLARRRVLSLKDVFGTLSVRFIDRYAPENEIAETSFRNRASSLINWIRVSDYEIFGSKSFGWLRSVSGQAGMVALLSHVSVNPSLVATFGLLFVSLRGHRLSGRWLYPVGRSIRARVAFAGSIMDAAGFFLLSTLLLVGLTIIRFPQLQQFASKSDRPFTLALIPAVMIWIPVAYWHNATSKAVPGLARKAPSGKSFLPGLVSVMLTVITLFGLRELAAATSSKTAILTGIAAAIITHALFWVALHWHFRTRDLA